MWITPVDVLAASYPGTGWSANCERSIWAASSTWTSRHPDVSACTSSWPVSTSAHTDSTFSPSVNACGVAPAVAARGVPVIVTDPFTGDAVGSAVSVKVLWVLAGSGTNCAWTPGGS